MNGVASQRLLMVTAGNRVCGLPLLGLRETMRPLPVQPLRGAPDFVRGLSLIRGASVPVVDLGKLLDAAAPEGGTTRRYVTLKLRAHDVALAVTDVLGTRDIEVDALSRLPRLLDGARVDFVEALGEHDAELLTVLRLARVIPEEELAQLFALEAAT